MRSGGGGGRDAWSGNLIDKTRYPQRQRLLQLLVPQHRATSQTSLYASIGPYSVGASMCI